MNDIASQLPPPANLAVAYTPVAFRPSFTLLLQLDVRFADIVQKAREPMIAQIKLAWWRDAFAAEPALRPKGEPLLQALGACGDVISPSALEDLVSAWELLLGEDEWTAQDIAKHAALRGGAIFGSYAAWIGDRCDVSTLSQQWAIDALRLEFPSKFVALRNQTLPALPKGRKLRSLSILAMSVRNVSGLRLIGHALTGW
jgi:15-cis-phytoene synthase